MDLAMLLSSFRAAVKKKYPNKRISAESIAQMIGVDPERYRKWEKGAMPNSQEDRDRLRIYYRLQDLEQIPNDALTVALAYYDHRMGEFLPKDLEREVTAELKEPPAGATTSPAVPDPAMPVMYQEVVRALIKAQDELIESAKAQRRMSDAQIEISKALLDERQTIKETAQATQETSKTLQKELAEMRSNWMKLEKSVNGSHLKLRALEQLAVNHSADLPKKKPTEIVNLLSGISEKLGQSKRMSNTETTDN